MTTLAELFTEETIGAIALFLLLIQGTATLILLSRLLKGAFRHPPLEPKQTTPEMLGSVSIVVPTLNEAERIGPCLEGLSRQSYEVREIVVVDSNSRDGTLELVKEAAKKDPRFRPIVDDPLPPGWVGRPWALQEGFLRSSDQSEWILGIDADTRPRAGLVASLISIARAQNYDIISLSPQFFLKYPGEWWLQPALLMTLLYRFDSAGVQSLHPERVMANGQCFFSRRSVLQQLGGYQSAAKSFCDDVTLARYAAACGFKVGFFDGRKLLGVRMYEGAVQTWKEWGRSLDLKDASSAGQLWGDLWLLLGTQGLPLPSLLFLLAFLAMGYSSIALMAATALNSFLIAIRVGMLWAIAPCYRRSEQFSLASWLFWLSPGADPIAVLRIFLSAKNKSIQWRGRTYEQITNRTVPERS